MWRRMVQSAISFFFFLEHAASRNPQWSRMQSIFCEGLMLLVFHARHVLLPYLRNTMSRFSVLVHLVGCAVLACQLRLGSNKTAVE